VSVLIKSVESGSAADRAGISAGQTLLSINGHDIHDVLDFRFYETERTVDVVVSDTDGTQHRHIIRKGEYDSLGLDFETYLMDKQRSCRNKCVFCFVDQTPKGMRETLYFKDDDERLSFLFGNYITLTNLSQRELERIVQMKITPINVSVHTTNPELRVRMMKNPESAHIMERLRYLAEGGIQLNCQLVLCPGWNDGAELERSLSDLFSLTPQVQSIALVPVGLTAHREGLEELRLFSSEEAKQVIETANRWAAIARAHGWGSVVWPADEFYIIAGLPFPTPGDYEDYPQLDNGVGTVALLRDEFLAALEDIDCDELPHRATIATGVSIAPYLRELADAAKEKFPGADWEVIPIVNDFFGHSITVAGLVTGGDIIRQLDGRDIKGKRLLIPQVMLRHGGDMFLDDVTPEQVEQALGVTLTAVPNDGYELLDALLGNE